MSKHTPGPWLYTDGNDGRSKGYIRAADQNQIGAASIAQVTLLRKGEWRANAALIAAAPEMLEVLKLVYALVHARPEPWVKSALPKIEAAIKKAEGGS